ncbi:MAG: hypothetical protein ACOY93_23305 [Bacillota bacterium]
MHLPRRILRPSAAELPLERAEVMRLLGYKEGRTQLGPRHLALVDQGIALAREAAAPAVSLAYCAVSVDGEQVATAVPGLTWRSRSLARLLREAVGVTLLAATLGPGIEEQTARLFAAQEYALATVVDAAGSALIHALALHARAELAGGDHALTPLYGPGYGDWPVQDQTALTEAAGGPAIGLRSTETCYLTPQKSLVGVVGWLPQGAGGRPGASGCSLCTLVDCAYRLQPR